MAAETLTMKRTYMADWVWIVAFFAAYVIVMRWVLPAFGVPT